MATTISMVKLLVLLAAMGYVAVASAEHGRPGSNVGVDHSGGKVGIVCMMQLEELEPCMDAVVGDAPFPPVPSDDCCFAIKTVDPACVCSAISKIDPSEYSGLNIQAALLLPTLCGRYVPQNFTCAEFAFGADKWGASLADRYARKIMVNVTARGYCGYNTHHARYLLNKIFPIPSTTPPLLVTVFFGANDAANPMGDHACLHVPLTEYKENLHKIIAHLKNQSPSTHVILISPPPVSEKRLLISAPILFGDTSGLPTRQNNITKLYAEECVNVAQETGVPVINMFSVIPEEGPGWDERWFSEDGIHLSAEGYGKLSEELVKIVENPGCSPPLGSNEVPWDFPQCTDRVTNQAALFKSWPTPI